MIKHIKKIVTENEKQNEKLSNSFSEKKEPYSNKSFSEKELSNMQISSSLDENMNKMIEILGDSDDVVTRSITIGRTEVKDATIIYINNLVDSEHVDEDILRPLLTDAYTSGLNSGTEIIEQLQAGNVITRGQTTIAQNFSELFKKLLVGQVIFLIDGINKAYIISAEGYKYRTISEPVIEPVVKGPKEAFIEILSINMGLIRRRIHSPNLVFEKLDIGTVSRTVICITYIKGICPTELVHEVHSRLEKMNIDGILESNYIEEFIQDNPTSIFPQIRNTERPDVVAASLLEGRLAIMIDNTPVVLIVPGEFFSLIQSPEDYYNGYIFSTLIRLLRYLSMMLAIFLPCFYIAVTNYHQELIPTGLLLSIIQARSKVPFPALIEAIIMEITFEILHEAGVRLAKPVGQAVSIVGALVIGQAAIQANISSPLMVIVVALTGIASFCLPQFNTTLPVRILRLPLMLLAAVFGLFGVMIGILFLMLHIFSLESFGKPYMTPLSPLRLNGLKDTLVRFPWTGFTRSQANDSHNLNDSKSSPNSNTLKKKRGL